MRGDPQLGWMAAGDAVTFEGPALLWLARKLEKALIYERGVDGGGALHPREQQLVDQLRAMAKSTQDRINVEIPAPSTPAGGLVEIGSLEASQRLGVSERSVRRDPLRHVLEGRPVAGRWVFPLSAVVTEAARRATSASGRADVRCEGGSSESVA